MPYCVAVTGATGFVGAALVHRMQAHGWRVRALLRSASRRRRLPDDVECVSGTLNDADALEALLQGADAIVHCAGLVRGAVASQFFEVNVSGLERLCAIAAARKPAPPYFLLMSSLAAREPALSPYAHSKRESECVLARRAGPMRFLALRPPAVYGPGDRDMLPLFKLMARGIAPVLGDGAGRFSLLYVEDLAAAVVRCLDARARGDGGAFELCDGKTGGYSWNEVIAIASRVCGRSISRLEIPSKLLDAMGAVNTLCGRALGYAPMLTTWKLRELRHRDWVCDNAAIQSVVEWRPEVSFAQGLRRTLGLAENP